MTSSEAMVAQSRQVPDLVDAVRRASIDPEEAAPRVAAGIDFILEGLHARKQISRSDERGYHASDSPRRPQPSADAARLPVMPSTGADENEDDRRGGGRKRKKQYN
jgi:hypothetical protein